MKLSGKFAATTKPKDVNLEQLQAYQSELYSGLPHTSATPREFSWDHFKAETDRVIDKAKALSGLDKFEELRGKFAKPISSGSTLEDAKLIKASLEAICFKLEKQPASVNKQLFTDEVKSSTLEYCTAGAGTNVQKILYAMQSSDYYQKYDYIQNLAAEYAREKKLSSQGFEVHKVNELIHEVSVFYNTTPPNDTYARYRDLSQPPSATFTENAAFVEYLGSHLASRNGVHSFASFLLKDTISRLPDAADLKDADFEKQGAAMQRLNVVLEGMHMNPLSILTEDDKGDYVYKADYEGIMEANVMRKLFDGGMIEQPDMLKIQGKSIIEAPSGWFLHDPKNAQGDVYQKLLDTKQLKVLNVGGKNLEEYLHESLKAPLVAGLGFEDALRVAVETKSQELGVQTDQMDINASLVLVSDEAKFLRDTLPKEKIATMSASDLNKAISDSKEELAFIKEMKFKYGIDFSKNINALDKDGNTALILAAKNGNADIVQKLLEKGADLHTPDKYGNTALILAAKNGYTAMVEKLLAKGANQNIPDKYGYTALMFAAQNGHEATVEKLLEKGANQNIPDQDGTTALMLAAENGNADIVQKLLEKGAGLDTKDKYGYTALMRAAESGHTATVEKLLEKGADLHTQSKGGATALILAAKNGRTATVEKLLEKGAGLHTPDKDGATALMYAAKNGRTATVEKLLEKGAGLDIPNKDGWTALIIAAYNGHISLVEKLLEKGAKIDTPDKDGNTALILAAKEGHTAAVEKLLEKGAGLDTPGKGGATALMCAAHNGHISLVEKLLEKGAKIDTPDKDGATALMYAAKNGRTALVEKLLEKGAGLDIPNKDGATALMYAAQNGHTATVEKLLAKGAGLDIPNKDGATALMYAAQNGHTATVEKLLAKGAKPNIKNKYGDNALSLALKSEPYNDAIVTKLLTSKKTPEALGELLNPLSKEEKAKIAKPMREAMDLLLREKKGHSVAKLVEHLPKDDKKTLQEIRDLVKQNKTFQELRSDPNATKKVQAVDAALKKATGSRLWPF